MALIMGLGFAFLLGALFRGRLDHWRLHQEWKRKIEQLENKKHDNKATNAGLY